MNTTVTIDRSKLYGVLHEPSGRRIVRQVRVLKVGIGVPTGPDVHVWIDQNRQWCVEVGTYVNGKRQSQVKRLAQRADAEAFYAQQRKTAPERNAPRKLPYFTFLRTDSQGKFVHDFDTIELHGPVPTEIDIVFLNEQAFDASFQAWSTSKLLCEGNGVDARRNVEWAQSPDERASAEQARKQNQRFFPIFGSCYTAGCRFAIGDKRQCKPHGKLTFQLMNAPTLGGSCQFDTTGFRSIAQLAGSLDQIRLMTGRGNPEAGSVAGIPLKFVLRPYKVQVGEKSSIQYGVSLEFRAKSLEEMARLLHAHTAEFRQLVALPAPASSIESEPVSILPDEDPYLPEEAPGDAGAIETPEEAAEAAAMTGEFYGLFPEEQEAAPPSAYHAPAPLMPRRRSDTAHQEGLA
jgi:Recombination directionality factor-like